MLALEAASAAPSTPRSMIQASGDLRAAQRFRRHKNLNHILRYDDNRQDLGGKVARLLEEELISPTLAAEEGALGAGDG